MLGSLAKRLNLFNIRSCLRSVDSQSVAEANLAAAALSDEEVNRLLHEPCGLRLPFRPNWRMRITAQGHLPLGERALRRAAYNSQRP